MENGKNKVRIVDSEELLKRFFDFCLIDLQLTEETVRKHHIYNLKKFFAFLRREKINYVGVDEIRSFLLSMKDSNPYTYSNMLKALKRFFRDFLKRPELVESFKFPSRPFNPPKIPSRKDLQSFYKWLKELSSKALFLIYATTGLRRKEVLNLRIGDIDFKKRMIIPRDNQSRTKKTWITFYNDEAEKALKEYLASFQNLNKEIKIFPVTETYFRKRCKAFERETGIKISPKILREWFACEMGRLGVPDRYVDAFCGRVPRSVLARHYTDFSPEKLKEIYDKANLKILR